MFPLTATISVMSVSPEARTVLLIGGDAAGAEDLRLRLEDHVGLVVARGGADGLRALYDEHPDVVVLGLDLPDADGLEVLQRIRELTDLPVLTVVPGDSEEERAAGLRAGADDCISGSVVGPETTARIEALLRRCGKADPVDGMIVDEFVQIDRLHHRVEVLGTEIELTPTEFRMLVAFAERPGRVLGHTQLLEMVWGDVMRGREEVKLYVSYLRRKLGSAAGVDPVETVRGVGYRYRPRRVRDQS